MRVSLIFCAILLSSTAASADGMDAEVCDTTAGIVAEAQVLRNGGDNENRATRKLKRTYKDLGDNYVEEVIPLLSNFVYMQPETVLDQDLAAFWKQTCLTTDLSSVLPTE